MRIAQLPAPCGGGWAQRMGPCLAATRSCCGLGGGACSGSNPLHTLMMVSKILGVMFLTLHDTQGFVSSPGGRLYMRVLYTKCPAMPGCGCAVTGILRIEARRQVACCSARLLLFELSSWVGNVPVDCSDSCYGPFVSKLLLLIELGCLLLARLQRPQYQLVQGLPARHIGLLAGYCMH